MAVNRLSAIRRIRVYKKDNKRVVSFRRSNSDKKFVPVKVFCQIIGAFIFSFAFHMPFFLELPYGTKVGLCNYYGGATDGKYRKELKHLFISSLYQIFFQEFIIRSISSILAKNLAPENLPDDTWENKKSCQLYLSLYLSFMKFIPTALIVGLNIAIAVRMQSISKVRRDVQENNVIVAGFPSTTENTSNPGYSRYIFQTILFK